jgi:phosphatidyl-myo-inositol alpha-mannosyltransferase
MKRMKIGFVLDDTLDTPDGVQQYVLTLGRWMDSQGYEVHYLVGNTTRTDIKHIHSLSRNFKVRFNGNRLSIPLPTSRSRLRELLNHEAFDVLHVQMPYSPWLAHRIIEQAPERTAVVGTFHILPNSRAVHAANRALAVSLRSTLKRFDKIFTVSSAAQSYAKQVYGIDGSVLPNVTDERRFAEAKPLARYDDGTLTIMFLGRLVPRKGCKTLLEAANILNMRNNLPPFRVVVCGKGPLEDELKQYVTDQRLDEVVSFTGFVPEVEKPRFIASADIMAFPSTGGESFGIVLAEAMAAGRAVVLAGDNDGYRGVLHDKPELLFPPGQPFELANRLTAYLRDEAARKQILAWEKKYVRQFDVAIVGKKLLDTYSRCCSQRNK